MGKSIKIDISVNGVSFSTGPFDETGFITNEEIESAMEFLEQMGLAVPEENVVAAIIYQQRQRNGA